VSNDIMMRLGLNAQQFSSEAGRAFGEMVTKARQTAETLPQQFNKSVADVNRIISTINFDSTGKLDLTSEVTQLKASADAAELGAEKARLLSIAFTEASQAAGVNGEALRREADAAAISSLGQTENANTLRARAAAMEIVHAELQQVVAATNQHTLATERNTVSAGQQRASMVNLGQQFGDFTVQVASGQSAFVAFAQQAPQAAYALGGFGGALGRVGAFLTGPWGIAITVGMVALTPFIAKLLESGEAADKALQKLKDEATQGEVNRVAKERFKSTLEGVTAAINDQTEALKKQADAERTSAEQANASAIANLERAKTVRDMTLALIKQAQADLQASQGQTFGAAGGAGAGMATSVYSGRLADLNALEKQAEAAITKEEINRQKTRVDLAAEEAKRMVDPIARINKLYDDKAKAAKDAARKEAEAGKQVTGILTAQLAVIEKARKAELDRQREADRDAKRGGITTSFMMPVNGPISSPFGAKRSYETHPGVDIAVPVGTPVRAPASGTVDAAGLQGKLGNTIVINFGAGTTARFGHLEKFNVKPGDTVDAGDIIGYSGGAKGAEGAGNSTGPHLHYEVRSNGKLVNPLKGSFPVDPSQAADDATKRAEQAKRQAEALAEVGQRAGDSILRINGAWDEQPKLIDRATIDLHKLDELAAELEAKKPPNYEAMLAQIGQARQAIEEGLSKPFNDFVRAQKEGLAVQTLTLQGRDVEAAAMQDILRIQQQQGQVSDKQIQQAYRYEAAQKAIAEALQDQQRILNISSGYVGNMQRDFDKFLEDMDNGNRSALPNLFKGWLNDFKQLQRDLISNAVFGGIDRDIEQYIRKLTGKQTPAEILAEQATDSGKVMKAAYDDAGSAVTDFATAVRDAMKNINGSSGSPFGLVGGPGNVTETPNTGDIRAMLQDGLQGILPANDNLSASDDIVITALRTSTDKQAVSAAKMLDASTIWTRVSQDLVKNFAQLGIDIPKGIADHLPGIMQGASIFSSIGSQFGGQGGNIGAGLGASLGALLKPDSAFMKNLGPYAAAYQLGQAISQPIGKALGLNPTAVAIGGVPGGLIAKLFGIGAPQHKGSAGIGLDQYGQLGSTGASGTSSQRSQGAASMADAVSQQLQQIADQLGAKITGTSDVRIGTYENHIRVNDHGGAIGGVKGSGAISFDTQEDAVAYAVQAALQDGILSGISAASLKILKSGQDISKAITKALAIESIPHDLKAMLDPLGSAVDDFNKKWKTTVDALNEGGATAEQMAQAQQLYNLQLEQIKANTPGASQALKDFLQSLKVGSNSPYSLRDQEGTAMAALKPFLDTIAAGGSIDQAKYQDAASQYLDIERQLYGSTQAYFDAMDQIQAATTKAIAAIDNAVPITPGVPDPFTKATADATNTVAANTQTTNELLVQLTDTINQQSTLLAALGIAPDAGFANDARNFLLKTG
jgi:murein DD-endopeptidase MepM/ murein hydrolase activator NlpD